MLTFPNCKINIGLRVTEKRADGYHNIESVFFPLPLTDVLEVIEAPPGNNTHLSISGQPVDGDVEDNLCMKAYRLLKQDFSALPPVEIYLHKVIPMGAGLGGGSADAAFLLKLLNETFYLGISDQQLFGYALTLGSDCPFFITNKSSLATGRGEVLRPVNLDLSDWKIMLINPGIKVSTKDAFQMIKARQPAASLEDLIALPVQSWRENIFNDFEVPVFSKYPEIADLKDQLYSGGAVYASMSGSGSSVYAIFEKTQSMPVNFPPHYFYKWF